MEPCSGRAVAQLHGQETAGPRSHPFIHSTVHPHIHPPISPLIHPSTHPFPHPLGRCVEKGHLGVRGKMMEQSLQMFGTACRGSGDPALPPLTAKLGKGAGTGVRHRINCCPHGQPGQGPWPCPDTGTVLSLPWDHGQPAAFQLGMVAAPPLTFTVAHRGKKGERRRKGQQRNQRN